MEKRIFGKTKEGQKCYVYTLENSKGLKVNLLDLGAAIQGIIVPDERGGYVNIVKGFATVEGYEKTGKFFGGTIGRHAGQIAGCKFSIDGNEYILNDNDHGNSMHGGFAGFNKRVFKTKIIDESSIKFSYLSPDMEEGYPGNLDVEVGYTLDDENRLIINYKAVSDEDTVLNMTNHSYFNLDDSSSILDHYLYCDSDAYCAIDKNGMPTGVILPVKGTPMDFNNPTQIGERIEEKYEQVKIFGGYDHNWILHNEGDINKLCVKLENNKRTRFVEVYTTKPGVQLYSGNSMDDPEERGRDGICFSHRGAICMETQFYPNALNNRHFPSVILKKGTEYNYTTIYKMGWKY